MRLALFSDIHGNPIALDAVLADIAALGGVDGYWVLGDLAAVIDAVERVHHPAAPFIMQYFQGRHRPFWE